MLGWLAQAANKRAQLLDAENAVLREHQESLERKLKDVAKDRTVLQLRCEELNSALVESTKSNRQLKKFQKKFGSSQRWVGSLSRFSLLILLFF